MPKSKDPAGRGSFKNLSPEEKQARYVENGKKAWSKAKRKDLDLSHEGMLRRHGVFLEALAEFGTIRSACDAADVSRRVYYDWIARYPDFKQAAEDAMERNTDELEEVAQDRAKDKSDLLLMFLLKKRRPEYRDNYQAPVGKPEEEEQQEVSRVEVEKKLKVLAERRIERIAGSSGSKEIVVSRSDDVGDEDEDEEPDVEVIPIRRKA